MNSTQERFFRRILEKMERRLGKMTTTIAQIETDLAAQKTLLDALVAAYNNLKNNANPGPGAGQLIVNQSDLDAIDAAITGETAEIPTEP